MCFEYEEGKYSNGAINHKDVGIFTSKELDALEQFYLDDDNYKGSICNVITHKPFMENNIEDGFYMCRYLESGTGSFKHLDFGYSGPIESLEDIWAIEDNIADDLGVEQVVVTDFMLFEEVESEQQGE